MILSLLGTTTIIVTSTAIELFAGGIVLGFAAITGRNLHQELSINNRKETIV